MSEKFKCCSCGKKYNSQDYFYKSYSAMFSGNNSCLPICKECLNDFYYEYLSEYGDEYEAMRRICMSWDMYFDRGVLYSSISSSSKTNKKVVGIYVKNLNLKLSDKSSRTTIGKTYDDTLREEVSTKIESIEDLKENKDVRIPQKLVKFWGVGYTPEEYRWLDDEYVSWIIKANAGEPPSKSLESMLKQICLLQVDIQRARQDDSKRKDISGLMSSYEKLLQKAGLQPIQEDATSIAEKNSLGVLIDYWENTEPVPEPEPQFRDVDNIKHYVNVWFTGHLSRIFGYKIDDDIKKEYQEEIDKYKVCPPEIEEIQYGGGDG